MGVAFWSVKEQVAYAGPRNVLLLGCDVGEDEAASYGVAGPFLCGAAEMAFSEVGEAEEPEVSIWCGCENPEPGAESRGVDLVKVC